MNLNLQTNTCDPERLESFLSGALSDVGEREFTLHLNTCENCRRSLQQQAAEPEAWMEAEKLLRPAEFDAASADEVFDSENLKHPSRQPLQIQNVLAALGPTDDPAMLGRLGGYEVSGVVGAGGMGVVLKAIDKSLDRTVAIKVLAPHLATSGAARKRFAREAKAAAAVLHPNVIAIHSVSNDESLPYLVMPYVRGTSLQKRLYKEGPLSLQEILRIGSQIAAGLAAAHAQGLVHRDIKPANILLEDGVERVTITDFGLARAVDDASITHSGVIAGTPQFMSPEQARGEAVDGRSDLFSLGSVLYAICTGRPPFRAETTYGVMRRITDDEPTSIRELNPDISAWLCSIIAKLMSKQAADRFASATEVSELLEKCLAHVQQPAAVPLPVCRLSFRESSATFAERKATLFHPRSLGIIAMIAAFTLGLLGMFLWQASEAPDIAGKWTGEGWGEVVLEKKQTGEYEGTYTDTFKDKPGTMQMKWSRLEGRYKGTWQEGNDRRGKISVRLVEGEIRGAWTTSEKSGINPGNPELADLLWKRSSGKERGNEFGEVKKPDKKITENGRQWTQMQFPQISDTDRKPKLGEIVVDLYGGKDVFKDQGARYQATVAKIVSSLNALPGVTVNIRPGGPGDSLTLAIVRDPYGVCRKEAQETQKKSKLEAAINEAIRSGGLKAIRWEGDVLSGDSKEAQNAKSRDHDKELQSTSNNPPRAGGDQTSNVIESLRVFDANHPPFGHFLPLGNVSKVSSKQGQVEVSLKKPGSAKVGDVLELSRPNPLQLRSYTRFAWVRVVEVQKSDEAVIAVLTHSTRHKVESRWEWIMPEVGDYVSLPVLKSEAEIPRPVLEPRPTTTNPLPPRESESELQKFQGTWALVSSESNGRAKSEANNPYLLTFLGTKWKVHRGDEVAVAGTLQLVDVTSTPRKFDLLKPKGLGPVPTVDYGIYEWKDDTLRYCVRNGPAGNGLPGMMDASELRPKEFVTRDGDGRMLYIWQRTVEGKVPGTIDSSSKEELRFSDTKEFVLSMDSLKFMLDLDTGKTMDPPATIRPEQEQMDVQTDQVQPYHYPTKLTGHGLVGLEVKSSDWDASAAEVRRALTGKTVGPLKEMDLGPEKNPTYFFKTRDGTLGVLQLLELVEKPKGIRLRYKTVVQRSEPTSPPENERGAIQKLIDGLLARSIAIRSGRIEYHLKIDTFIDSDFIHTFSGESWAQRYPKSTHARVNHDGRLISYWTTPQKDGTVSKTLRVELPESAYENHPYPPVRAGTFWESTTSRFVRDRAGKARLLAAEFVNGVETQVLEWDVAAADAYEAFYAVNALSQGGGKLRLYVAPQLGHVLPRIEHVDRFGSVQSLFDSSDFKEVAPNVYFPTKSVWTAGAHITAYDIKSVEKCNQPISEEEFLVAIPAGTSVADSRPKSKDSVGPDGKRMTSYEVYPMRVFNTGAAYPKGFPAELLKELDRDVIVPKRVHQFPTAEKVNTIAISPDGKLIAIANGDVSFPVAEGWKRSVEILDAETGKAVVSLQLTTKEEDAILAATEGLPHVEVGPIAFSPSENVVAVGTGMGQVKIFNARTGELLQSLDDEKAKLAEKTTPEKLKSLKRAMGSIGSLAFSPDGTLLAMTGSSFDDVARNWGGVRRLGRLATGPGRLKVWEVKTGTLKHDLAGHSHAEAASFSPDGTLLASAGRWGGDRDNGNGVLIWNSQTGQKVSTILQEANGGTHAVVFSPTKKLVTIGSRHYDKENDAYKSSVVLANALSGIVEWTQMIPGSAEPMAFSPDGKNVLTLCGGESIQFIETESGQIKQDIKCAGFLPATPRQGSQWLDFAITPTGPRLAIGGVDKERKGSVEIWSLEGLGAAANPAPAK